jgi:hypothetical protein
MSVVGVLSKSLLLKSISTSDGPIGVEVRGGIHVAGTQAAAMTVTVDENPARGVGETQSPSRGLNSNGPPNPCSSVAMNKSLTQPLESAPSDPYKRDTRPHSRSSPSAAGHS